MYSKNTRKRRAKSLSIQRVRNTSKRPRSLSRKASRIVTKLGEGAFGTVQRSPLPCAPFEGRMINNTDYNRNIQRNINSKGRGKNLRKMKPYMVYLKHFASDKFVSKLTDYPVAHNEYIIGQYIKEKIENWSDYYCLVEYVCKSDKIATNADPNDTIAILPYCGISLHNLISDKPSIVLNSDEWWFLLDRLKIWIDGVIRLHMNCIYHNDIHDGNVVFNMPISERNVNVDNKYKVLLIDFGQSNIIGANLGNNNSREKYIATNQEIDDLDNLVQKVLRPVLEYIIDNNIFKGDNIERNIQQLLDKIDKMDVPYKTHSEKQLEYMINKYYDIIGKYKEIIPPYE
jgi:serine/threonine protein kinase